MPWRVQDHEVKPLSAHALCCHVDGHAALTLGLVLVGKPSKGKGRFAHLRGQLQVLLVLPLVDVIEQEKEAAGEG